ncbi:MAG: hypothetical protein RLZZ126_431 [Pseudomonadota bacterium]|jgi:hypothetical protein
MNEAVLRSIQGLVGAFSGVCALKSPENVGPGDHPEDASRHTEPGAPTQTMMRLDHSSPDRARLWLPCAGVPSARAVRAVFLHPGHPVLLWANR